jgi:hypothetical protein
MNKEKNFKELDIDSRLQLISDFISDSKENPDKNYYIIDGQHRSGNNFWNILFTYNIKGHQHKLFGHSFHNPRLYQVFNKNNKLKNVYHIITFREPWEATKSYLVLSGKEESATYEDVATYLDTCEAFYDTIINNKNTIIPIDLGFGSINSKKIVYQILSLGNEDVYNSFEDMNIDQENTKRHNIVPLYNNNKKELIDKAEGLMNNPKIIKHVSEVSKKYYEAKLYASKYWEERGI